MPDFQEQGQSLDFLGPLLASVGAFPFVPQKLGKYMEDVQKLRGLGDSWFPTWHGTRTRYEGLPAFMRDAEVDTGPGLKTTYSGFNPKSSVYIMEESGKRHGADPRIMEQITDMSNVGYAPWEDGQRSNIYEDMFRAGRSGVILDPTIGTFPDSLDRNLDVSWYRTAIDNVLKGDDFFQWMNQSGMARPRNLGSIFGREQPPDVDELTNKLRETLGNEMYSPQLVLWDRDTPRHLGQTIRPTEKGQKAKKYYDHLRQRMTNVQNESRRRWPDPAPESVEREWTAVHEALENLEKTGLLSSLGVFKPKAYDLDNPRWYLGE